MRYALLGEHTGLRVSKLVLGTAMFGTRWGYGCDTDEAGRIFANYVDNGGNFIDTADNYQVGESEALLGDLIQPHRDDLVIGTKFSQGGSSKSGLGTTGNSRKSMVHAVEQSLRRLKTDRIDLYWVHLPDGMTPIDEIARGLDELIVAGKVLHAGLSDFPAWRTARAVTLAELRGWHRVAAQQVEYSLVQRTPDRDLLPMAEAFGLATLAWSPLGGGLLTGKYRRGENGRHLDWNGRLFHAEDTAQKTAILNTVEAIAEELACTPGQLAIAWTLARGTLPILGPRSLAQLQDNMGALHVQLTPQHMDRLNLVSLIPLGFPHDLIGMKEYRDRLTGGHLDALDLPARPVR